MNVLITGGAGYIGTELIGLLSSRPDVDSIIVYDNLSNSNYNMFIGHGFANEQKIRFENGELLDSRHLKKALEGVDVVYHLAAKVATPYSNTDPHFYEQINHWGTAELVYAIENSNVSKLIYTSSVSVYGSSKESVDESTVANPRTFYGISKMRGEEHVMRLSDKLDTFMLRCGNVYGYNRSARFDAVINKFVFEAHFNKKITIHGDGKQRRSFVHVNLLGRALEGILNNNLDAGLYNIVDKDLEILDIVDVLKELIPDLEFIFINQHLKLRQLRVKTNAKVRSALNLVNELSLKEELAEFITRFSF